MFFYCTSKIKNYHKVGIANSWKNIKGRLSSYRSINPNTYIKFFSEVNNVNIERTFKNKFHHFRVGKSECYELRSDIIYKHLLKYLHKDKTPHCFWNLSRLYISTYYISGNIPRAGHDFSERDETFYNQKNFIPVAEYQPLRDKNDKFIKNSKGENKYLINYIKLNKNYTLKDFSKDYQEFLEKKYWKKNGYDQRDNFDNFCDENFKEKIVLYEKNDDAESPSQWFHHYQQGKKIIYEMLKQNTFGLIKSYNDENEYSSIAYGVKSSKLMERIQHSFRNTYSEGSLERIIREDLDAFSWQDKNKLLNLLQSLNYLLTRFPTARRGSEIWNETGTALENPKREMKILRELKKSIKFHQDKIDDEIRISKEKIDKIHPEDSNIVKFKKK